MLDQLKTLVQQYGEETIVNNPTVPEQHKTAAVKDVAEQIYSGLKNQAKEGNIVGLTTLFVGTDKFLTGNPIVKQIEGSVASSLASKFGLTSFASHQIATNLIPNVLEDFATLKDFNLQDTLGSLGAKVKVPDQVEDLAGKTFGN